MHIVDIMKSIAATSSRKEKEEIVKATFLSGHTEFFIAAQLVYDVLVTFGVAKVAEILEADDSAGTLTFEDFLVLANKLKNRELTGHAARDAINAAANSCHVETWNLFYRRILMKDFGIGLTEGTINKVLNSLLKTHPNAAKFIVPTFECQLAHNGEKPEHQKHMRGEKLLDQKADGVRLLAIIDKENNTVTHHMRDGKPNYNFPTIRDAMLPLLDILPASMVLDGEVMSGSFQELMTKISKIGADTSNEKLFLFDVIPLKDFREGFCKITQRDRHALLSEMETNGLFKNTPMHVMPKVSVNLDTPEGQKTFEEFNRRALAEGLEGIMIKDPEAPYESKRSVAWLKKKPKISVTLTVVGFEAGDPEGKNKDRLGALLCEGTDDGVMIKTKCGGGFSDEQRDQIWNNKEKYLRMMVEVEADCLTQNQNSEDFSLRFPVLKGFRGRVPGEKI